MLIKCPLNDTAVTVDDCLECGAKCLHGNLPLHLARLSKERPVITDQWSVTQITSPLQITVLKERNAMVVDPMDGVFATWGTAWHKMVEGYSTVGNGRYIAEDYFEGAIETPLGHITLTGTPDLYDKELQTLWDYKTTKAYSMGKAWKSNEEWFWQLNLYRFWHFPEAKRMFICGAIRDYGWQTKERDGLDPITIKEVPIYDDKVVLDYTVTHLTVLKRCQDEGIDPPECTDADRWMNYDKRKNKKVYMRCERYCAVADVCPQWQGELNEETQVVQAA